MKQMLLGACALSFILLAFRTRTADPLTDQDRKFAIDYYEKTKQRLLDDVKGLSQAQLNWKADSTRWSIYQCTEHIALAESFIFGRIQQALQQPADPAKRSEEKFNTDQLIGMMTDRSHKAEAPAPIRPATQFADEAAALRAFVGRRDSTINYIRSTQDDLKDHFVPHPIFGTVDLYQVLILMAAHSARHTLQIEEVKNSPGFPKM
jgi:uncharacterized damage-inducible protein DinB